MSNRITRHLKISGLTPTRRVPKAWREGTHTDQPFFNQCYEMAFRYVLDHLILKDLWLVHGGIKYQGISLCYHAWVLMPSGIIFDGTLQQFFETEPYYKAKSVRPMYQYHALAMWLLKEHISEAVYGKKRRRDIFGGWEQYLRLPCPSDCPVIVDWLMVKRLIDENPPASIRQIHSTLPLDS